MKYIIVALCSVFCASGFAVPAAVEALLPSDHYVIRADAFAAVFDPLARIPRWTIYQLTPELARKALSEKGTRKGLSFKDDYSVLGCPAPRNYRKSGWDMGHLVPGDELGKATFVTWNCAPQRPLLNRGRWKSLEYTIRKRAASGQTLTIVTGVLIFNPLPRRIGKESVVVPDFFYKVILETGEGWLEKN